MTSSFEEESTIDEPPHTQIVQRAYSLFVYEDNSINSAHYHRAGSLPGLPLV